MKVSILTVCHNQLAHTKRFIASLKRFTPQEPIGWNLLIVDSGSTDGTSEYIYSILRDDRFRSEPFNKNVGWIKGINEGLKWFQGDEGDKPDILIFANNDIVFDSPGWLERLCKHFDNPAVGAVGPTSNYVMGRQNSNANNPHAVEEETHFLVGFCFAVRREVVEAIGPLSEDLADFLPPGTSQETRDKLALGGADDLDYSIRIRQAGWKLVIARDVFVWHAGSKTFLEVVGPDGYNQQWKTADLALERKWGKTEVARLHEAPLNFAIGIPLRGWHTHWKFSRSFAFLQKPWKWNLLDAPRGVVDQSRNAIVQKALEIGASHILFLDDDHTFPPELFFRLYSYNVDVVGALGFRRVEPFSPCVFSWETNRENGNLVVRDHPEWINTGLRKVDAIGFGAVLIRMDVFTRLGPPPWFKFNEVGEDLEFCNRCALAGVSVHCDTSLIVPHINDEGIEVSDATFGEYHRLPLSVPSNSPLMPQALSSANTKTITSGVAQPGVPWVGSWELTRSLGYVRQLVVLAATSTSIAGTFTFEYGEDGSTATISEVRPIGDFTTVRDFDLLNAGAYFRVKFEPGSGLGSETVYVTTTHQRQFGGAFVRLANQEIEEANAAMGQTFAYLKAFVDATGKSTNIRADKDGNLIVGEYTIAVAEDVVPNTSAFRKFGTNASIGTSETYIAVVGGTTPWFPTVAATLEVVSSSANDTAAGSGAREITIIGLNASFVEVTQTLATAGTSASSATGTALIRITRTYVSVMGTYRGSNAGTITVRISGAGATVASIPVGLGQSQLSGVCVPAGRSLYVTGVNLIADSSKAVSLRLWQAPGANDVSTPFAGAKRIVKDYPGIVNPIQFIYRPPIKFTQYTDIWFTGFVGTSTGSASVEYSGIYVTD